MKISFFTKYGFTLLKYGFTLLGLCLLLIALYLYQNQKSFISKATTAEGTVVELVQRTRIDTVDTVYYYPTVEFHTNTNERIKFTSTSGTNPPAYSRGEKVEVLYLPSSPQDASIKGFFPLWGGTTIVGGVGAVFFLIGGALIAVGRLKAGRKDYLKQHGARIETELIGVEINKRVEINGSNPFRVVTQWLNPATGKLHTFKSNDLWSDPSGHIKGRKITVFLERNNPEKYYVDLSFLPEDDA